MADQKRNRPIIDLTPADVERFWSKVDRSGDGCWLWPKRPSKMPYGQFGWGVRKAWRIAYAHRIAYVLTHDAIPAGLDVLHRCDTPTCVNPDHLRVGTHLDNMREASERGRLNVPHLSRRKVSDNDLDVMRARRRAGEKLDAIAADFNVSKTFVSLVARGLRRAA